ncbi:MAG: FtsQ-type POTRA domain-containing protein [Candidatus Komeilibacteria bacterium]|nr:FtsQ-type POTRA domain-containing protein [Candidatus Komeilibacteria bacterium]
MPANFRRPLPKISKPIILASSASPKVKLADLAKSKRSTQIKQEQSNIVKRRTLYSLTIVLAGYLLYFLFLSSYFRLEYLIVSGNNQTPSSEIEPIVWQSLSHSKFLILPGDNYFLASIPKLTENLGKNFIFNKLIVTKSLPKTIIINVEEKLPRFIWSTNGHYYVLTGDGLIIREFINYKAQKAIPLIVDQSNSSTSVNQVVVNNQILSLITKIKETLEAEPIPNLEADSFELADRGSQFIKLKTVQGAEIHLGQELDVKTQLDKLRKIIQSNHLDLAKVSYINLRIPEQAIYKLK